VGLLLGVFALAIFDTPWLVKRCWGHAPTQELWLQTSLVESDAKIINLSGLWKREFSALNFPFSGNGIFIGEQSPFPLIWLGKPKRFFSEQN